jgi:hypothetical protein
MVRSSRCRLWGWRGSSPRPVAFGIVRCGDTFHEASYCCCGCRDGGRGGDCAGFFFAVCCSLFFILRADQGDLAVVVVVGSGRRSVLFVSMYVLHHQPLAARAGSPYVCMYGYLELGPRYVSGVLFRKVGRLGNYRCPRWWWWWWWGKEIAITNKNVSYGQKGLGNRE